MSTTNLNITLIAQSQNSKYVTANEAISRLAKAISDAYSIDLSAASGDVTADESTALDSLILKFTGALGGAVNYILPAYEKIYIAKHDGSGYDVTLKTASSSATVTVSPSGTQWIWCNGTDMFAIGASGSGSGGAASAKTREILDGTGGTNTLTLAASVDPNSVEVYKSGLRLVEGASPQDYTVTEAGGVGAGYDTLTPSYEDAFPIGTDNIVVYYYGA